MWREMKPDPAQAAACRLSRLGLLRGGDLGQDEFRRALHHFLAPGLHLGNATRAAAR